MAVLIKLETTGPAIFVQQRVGLGGASFAMYKFRSMVDNAESEGAQFASMGDKRVTPIGKFIRKYRIDELPQLYNVLRGDMSLVGPRPCLLNQHDLIVERASRGVFSAQPGITGLAQIQGIDMSTPELLAKTDAEMLKQLNLFNYFRYIFVTLLGKGAGDRVNTKP